MLLENSVKTQLKPNHDCIDNFNSILTLSVGKAQVVLNLIKVIKCKIKHEVHSN